MVDDSLVRAGIAVVVLAGVAAGASAWAGIGHGRDVVVVTVRAVAQLLLVAAVIRLVFTTPQWAPVYLGVMLAAATWTSGRRLYRRGVLRPWLPVGAAIAAAAVIPVAVVVLTGALASDVNQVVPFTAQMVGGAMTATTLASQRMLDDVASGWATVEGWLALGAGPEQAVREPARVAAGAALLPVLDQTRNVGLVVLPGAYVGLLLGGATPLEAGRLQLLVLISLVAVEMVAAVLVTRSLSSRLGSRRPGVS